MGKLRTVVALFLVLALAAYGEVIAVQPRAGDVDLQVPAAEMNITSTHPAPLRLNDNLTISALVNNIGTRPAVNVAQYPAAHKPANCGLTPRPSVSRVYVQLPKVYSAPV